MPICAYRLKGERARLIVVDAKAQWYVGQEKRKQDQRIPVHTTRLQHRWNSEIQMYATRYGCESKIRLKAIFDMVTWEVHPKITSKHIRNISIEH